MNSPFALTNPLVPLTCVTSRWHNWQLAALLLLASAILLTNLSSGDLSGYDDAAYAHEAKVVLQTGDWLTLRLNGRLDFDKPPLFIWIEAISFRLFGFSDWAAKLPAALCALATLLVLWRLSAAIGGDHGLPLLSVIILLCTQYFLKYAMHAMTDVPFTFFFTLAMYWYVKGLRVPRYLLAAGVATGLASLLRLPIGCLPIGIVFLHLLWCQQYNVLRSWYLGGFLVGALILPLGWMGICYGLHGKAFFTLFFANVLQHAAAAQPKLFYQQLASYFEYGWLVLKLYWPWLPLLLLGFGLAFQQAWRERTASSSLLVLWLGVVILPLSLAESKVLRYLLPVFPAFSILAAQGLQRLLTPPRIAAFVKLAYCALALLAIILISKPQYRPRATDMRALAPLIRATTAPQQRVLLYTAGEYQWDYRNQLLWYGERLCWHLVRRDNLLAAVACDPQAVAVMDRASYLQLSQAETDKLETLGTSNNFVCLRQRTAQASAPALTIARSSPVGTKIFAIW